LRKPPRIMDIEKLKQVFADRIKAWEESQKGQTSGLEYERSLRKAIEEIGNAVLQESLGEIPKSKNEKKS
jgi:hypothetical protein